MSGYYFIAVQALKIKRSAFNHMIIPIMEMGKFAKMLDFPFGVPETTLWTWNDENKFLGNALIFS